MDVFYIQNVKFVLGFCTCIYIFLAAINHSIQPCLITWVNHVRTTSFLVAAWATLNTLMLEYRQSNTEALNMLYTGWAVILVTSVVLYFRREARNEDDTSLDGDESLERVFVRLSNAAALRAQKERSLRQ